MTTWFISDTHFNHKNVLKFCPNGRRHHTDVEEMNNEMIENWNRDVKKNDDVYMLGDFAFGGLEKVEKVLKELNGKIHFIRGNHDKIINENINYFSKYFESYQDYKEIKINRTKIVMFHYPIESWNGKERGSLHLHGHTHCNEDENGVKQTMNIANRIEVCIDCRNDLSLFSLEEIFNLAENS